MGKNKNNSVIIGLIIFLIGIGTVSYDYINTKVTIAYDKMAIKLIDNNQLVISDDIISNNVATLESVEANVIQTEETPAEIVPNPTGTYNYIGYLEIPKINVKKGFLEINSVYNNVNKNVSVLKESDMPDVVNGNFILASHSGNSSVAFFANLYKLNKGDQAFVTYKGKKYKYQIVDIYNQSKVGTISIYTEKNKTSLTLITCTYGDKTAQTVYIAELISTQ